MAIKPEHLKNFTLEQVDNILRSVQKKLEAQMAELYTVSMIEDGEKFDNLTRHINVTKAYIGKLEGMKGMIIERDEQESKELIG